MRGESLLTPRLMRRRRALLEMGTLGAVGLSLPALLRARETMSHDGEDLGRAFGRAKRCILVFLNGGPSHIDTWDMKPNAPLEVRGELKSISTNVPGLPVCELLPHMARQADRLRIVRSVSHSCTVHTSGVYTMLTGVQHATPTVDQTQALPSDHPHLGAIYSKWRGWKDHLPPFVCLPTLFRAPPVTGIWPGQNAGFLGRRFDPLVIQGDRQTARFALPEVTLAGDVSPSRLQQRRSLVGQLDTRLARLGDRQLAEFDGYSQQAIDLLRSNGLRRAVDLDRESATVRDRYGRHLFGQGLLLARRPVDAGLPLVTVYWIDPTPAGAGGGEFDSHGRIYHHMRQRLMSPLDRGLSALVADLAERGLLHDTLLVVLSEFGRTPRINAQAGRDHWPFAQTVLMAGAGITGGTIYGATDATGAYPTREPVSPEDLAQTVLHLLGVPANLMLVDSLGRLVPSSRGVAIRALCV
jgi:hypothetical protein